MKNTIFSVLLGLVMIVIAVSVSCLLSNDAPQKFTESTDTVLKEMLQNNHSFSAIQFAKNSIQKDSSIIFIDLRKKSEFDKGHLAHATNIYATNVLSKKNTAFLIDLNKKSKQIVLYAKDAATANSVHMILKQMGINTKVLAGNYNYYSTNNSTKIATSKETVLDDELAITDITAYIKDENAKASTRLKLEKEKKILKRNRPIKKRNVIIKHKPITKPAVIEDEEDEGC